MTDVPHVVHLASGREWRGGQRQVLLLTRELARAGVPQILITGAGSRLAREAGAAGVPVKGVAWRTALSGPALGAAWRAARRGRAVLHAHDGHAVTIAWLAGLLARRPFVATRRTVFPLQGPRRWRRAARVIAISNPVRQRLLEAGIPGDRIAVVPSGIDLDATRAVVPGEIRRALRLPEGRPLAVHVAAFTREKDHDTLLEAAALLASRAPSLYWVLAGDGPLRQKVERRARDLGLGERISFPGWVDEPLPLIAAAAVFVLSSTQEGMGTVLLDAMALGIPVVATRVGGVPDVVGSGGMLVQSRDPEAIAGAVSQLLMDQSLTEKLRDRAAASVTAFTAAGMAGALIQVYRSV